MNIIDLFAMQRRLDNEIEINHPIQPMEDRFEKKKLALLVEIGELANEVRTWKFWSKDQQPRTEERKSIIGTDENGGPYDSYEIKNPVLEEYVDCIHFLLSIGNEYAEYVPGFYKAYNTQFNPLCGFNNEDLPAQFNAIFRNVSRMGGGRNEEFHKSLDLEYFEHVFLLFIGLGSMLCFSEEMIVDAYMQKNEKNWQRQENGY